MKILVIKMSSMGDVIHCLPAVNDLLQQLPEAQIDWVVEEAFVDIVKLQPKVNRVLPIAIRRWRSSWLRHFGEVRRFRRQLREVKYDVVIDAQGLIKSALVASMSRGPIAGFCQDSAREPLASKFYQHRITVPRHQHAISRQRQLFAGQFDYALDERIDYGLSVGPGTSAQKRLFFFHGTTWQSKHWPDQYWHELASLCVDQGYEVVLPAVTPEEQARAKRIQNGLSSVTILPPGNLAELAQVLTGAAGAVAVDTGLGHLAAALNIPLVGLFGPTRADLTGFAGPRQEVISDSDLNCAPCMQSACQYQPGEHSSKIFPPCFAQVTPERVLQKLLEQVSLSKPSGAS